MAPYKVAIVGTGMIANVGHIPAWLELVPAVEVVGVFNHTLDKAQQTADRHGIPHAYDDCERMMDALRPDIVSVCTPNASHRAYTEAALQAGAHVFCEKPIAASYADAVAMYAAAKAAGRQLLVAQTSRFSSANTAAKQLADNGHLGEMYYAETSAFRRCGVPTLGRFHIKEASGGGPLYDLGVHALDALLWIMGNPKVVAASGATYTKLANQQKDIVASLADSGAPEGVFAPRDYDSGEYDVEDMAAGFLRLENDATVGIRASWAANLPDGAGGTFIMGTKGGLTFNPLTFIGALDRYQSDTQLNVPPDPSVPFSGHWKAAGHFVEVLQGRAELLVRKGEVLNVMAALDGLYRSAAEGREVKIGCRPV